MGDDAKPGRGEAVSLAAAGLESQVSEVCGAVRVIWHARWRGIVARPGEAMGMPRAAAVPGRRRAGQVIQHTLAQERGRTALEKRRVYRARGASWGSWGSADWRVGARVRGCR
jgi:hypothetical protein